MSNRELAIATGRSMLAIIVSVYLALKVLDDVNALWGIELRGVLRDLLLLVVAWLAFALSSKEVIKEIRRRKANRNTSLDP